MYAFTIQYNDRFEIMAEVVTLYSCRGKIMIGPILDLTHYENQYEVTKRFVY